MSVLICVSASNFRYGVVSYKKGDFKRAKRFFELAIQKDDSLGAKYMLGRMYYFGEGVEQDIQKAEKLLSFAAKYGNIKAKCLLSDIVYNSGDKKRAIELLTPGLKRGVGECKIIAKTNRISIEGMK
jgi:TPR repeat protein